MIVWFRKYVVAGATKQDYTSERTLVCVFVDRNQTTGGGGVVATRDSDNESVVDGTAKSTSK